MNKDCEIIQDLMPLVIDGVCSDKSREAVEDHVKECPVCAGIYGDLKKDLICGKVPEGSPLPEAVPAGHADRCAGCRRDLWIQVSVGNDGSAGSGSV